MKPPSMKWPAAYDLSCSDDGRLLACLGRNVVVIDITSRRRLSTSHPLSHPSHAAFSPGSSALAVKATSGRIVVMDPCSGKVLHDHKNQKEGEGSQVHFSPSGEELVDGSWDGALTIRSARASAILTRELFLGEMITRITHDLTRRIWLAEHKPTVRPGENMPAPGYITLRQWPFSTETTRTFSFGWHIESASLSPDGLRFCFIQKGDVRRLHVARTSDGQILSSSIPMEVGGTGSALAWSGDGQHIGAVSKGMFMFYRADDLAVVGRLPSKYPSSIAFLVGGGDLALGCWDKSAILKVSDVLIAGAPSA
jgi:WD40 repeat protein